MKTVSISFFYFDGYKTCITFRDSKDLSKPILFAIDEEWLILIFVNYTGDGENENIAVSASAHTEMNMVVENKTKVKQEEVLTFIIDSFEATFTIFGLKCLYFL